MIGVDIGGTKALGVVIGRRNEILLETRWPTRATAAAVIDMLADMVAELIDSTGSDVEARGVGIGIAGLVDVVGRLRRPNLVDADGSSHSRPARASNRVAGLR
ncbi:MAG: ROK family protein [Acidimicrobiales bacterium]